ncbi:MAG: SMP-30/gluconolactonase/LRE family protein [Deltaproteobacteria bacterium]|nr:SMP-30/gluconolactonase/LRE family protein [Deltaproteobacteria bacterium]
MWVAGGALAALLGYLLAWPVPIEPVAWQAPRAPAREGAWAPNDRLRAVERIGAGQVDGPEATAIDGAGRVFTGTRDGRILRLEPGARSFALHARTGGRPLGMAAAPGGGLVVADAEKGLLSVSPAGEVKVLATGHGGLPFRLTDDVVLGSDGTAYFTDASSRFGLGGEREDVLEHAGRGRLLAWRPQTGATELLLSGLQFANGVALSGDESFLLVNETGAYRIVRYWLAGPRRGTSEPFLENLPGLPDNLTWSAERRAFWVALFSPRVAALDLLAPHPWLRKLVLRLPLWIQPQPRLQAMALAVDEQGRVVEWMEDASAHPYAPVTSVREHAGFLWLGSLREDALGRVGAPPIPR